VQSAGNVNQWTCTRRIMVPVQTACVVTDWREGATASQDFVSGELDASKVTWFLFTNFDSCVCYRQL